MDTIELLCVLLRCELCGGIPGERVRSAICPEQRKALFAIAGQQDILALVGDALDRSGLLPPEEPVSQAFRERSVSAVHRVSALEHELRLLCRALEQAEIPFIPLKGSVMRTLYPENWMRTSDDIDVLVRREDMESADRVLTEELRYRPYHHGNHDWSYDSPHGVRVELHYKAMEDGLVCSAKEVLSRIWDCSAVQEGSSCRTISDDMFYFYHIAHMAKHFRSGGCGMRPFLDLWILNHRLSFDREARETLLREGGLLPFAEAAEKLSEVWLGAERHDAMSRRMEEYILSAGLFGSMENRVAVQSRQEGKPTFIKKRIFLPYEQISYEYPILQKHPWLTPLMQLRRWGRLLLPGRWRSSVRELRYTLLPDKEKTESAGSMLRELFPMDWERS